MVINFVLIRWLSHFLNLYYQNDETATGVLIKFFNPYHEA